MRSIEKIVIIISNISMGGAQRVAFTLARWLISQNIDAVVIALGSSYNNYEVGNDIKLIKLEQKSKKEAINTVRKLHDIISSESPSVVITMGVPLCIYTVPAIFGTHVPHIISERNDPNHFLGKKFVAHIARLLMQFADGFVFQTPDARAFYCEKIQKRSRVIPNPLLASYLPEAKFKKGNIVTVGRLTAQKNHKLLIDSFALFVKIHPKFCLNIYGSGELRDKTKDYVIQKGLQHKIFINEACNDVLERIKSAEMFVMSSDFEGMPNALMEAMAMGLPCISTDCPCGGPKFLIEDEENGLLVPVGDCHRLLQAMEKIAEDETLRIRISQNAKLIKDRLSVDIVCNNWLEFCYSIINI